MPPPLTGHVDPQQDEAPDGEAPFDTDHGGLPNTITECMLCKEADPEECLSCGQHLCMEHMCSHDCELACRQRKTRIALIEAFKGSTIKATRLACYQRWYRYANEFKLRRAYQFAQGEMQQLRQQLQGQPGGADKVELVKLRVENEKLQRELKTRDELILQLRAEVEKQVRKNKEILADAGAPTRSATWSPGKVAQAKEPAPVATIDPDDDLL